MSKMANRLASGWSNHSFAPTPKAIVNTATGGEARILAQTSVRRTNILPENLQQWQANGLCVVYQASRQISESMREHFSC